MSARAGLALAAFLGGVSLVGAPLYVSSSASAAAQDQLAHTCRTDSALGLEVPPGVSIDEVAQIGAQVPLVDPPMLIGQVLVHADGGLRFVPEAQAAGADVVVHRESADDPSQAFAISRLDTPDMTHVPMGVFRSVARPTYDDLVRAQVRSAVEGGGGPATDADLNGLIHGKDTWTVA